MRGRAVAFFVMCVLVCAVAPMQGAGARPAAAAGPASRTPFGRLDGAARIPGAVRVNGWAVDPDTSAPVVVHVYVDGVGAAATTAGLDRPDVGRAYPSLGSHHGFDVTVPVEPAPHTVCAYAINVGGGGNPDLGCTVVGDATVGALDAAIRRPGHLELRGWAIDPDAIAAVPIHVYVDGVGAAIGSASLARPDVERSMPGYGAAHGFDITIPVVGNRSVCAYAISVGAKPHLTLGCVRTSGAPVGALDALTRPGSGGALRVRGWALDPDIATPIAVHVYIDGVGRAVAIAGISRPDVGRVFPDWGTEHGYDATINGVEAGVHQVCTYGISAGGSANATLGCGTVAISAAVDPSLVREVLTVDGHDSFGILTSGTATVVSAPRSNAGGNTRVTFRRAADVVAENETSCARWTNESEAVNQQGVALRISDGPAGARRAITVTKNVYLGPPWVFNAHVWGTGVGAGFTQIAGFDLSRVFRTATGIRPLPWSLCARVVGDVLSFVAWPGNGPQPAWSDPTHGGSVRLPSGWDYVGHPGWYVGHLRPGDSTTFADLSAGPVSIDASSTFTGGPPPRAPTARHLAP